MSGLGKLLAIDGWIDKKVYKAVVPVFCGPSTKNLGNCSHDLFRDQIR